MKVYTAKNIRNVAFVGHGGDGKTTITEAMLFAGKVIDRQGKTEDGNTVSDFDPEEIKRKISISTSIMSMEAGENKINIIDTPGYFDFVGEAYAAYALCDTAAIVLSAVSGISVGAEKAFTLATKLKRAKAFIINQMDKENASFFKTVDSLKSFYGNKVTVLQLPIGEGLKLKGYVDVITGAAYEGGKKVDLPAELEEKLAEAKEALIENAAENDDELMEKFFGGEELTAEDITRGIRMGMASESLIPVFITAAANGFGISALTSNIIALFPSPADMEPIKALNTKTKEEVLVKPDEKAPFAAQVIKTVADPFVGKLSVFKVYSGSLTTDKQILNVREGRNEKLAAIYMMRGKKQLPIDKICAGDIGAFAKLQFTNTSDSLADPSFPVKFSEIEYPKPCISLAVSAKKQGEEDKVFGGLHKLAEEDPTFTIVKADTGDTLLSGLGEMHLEVICSKLANKFKVDAELTEPKVPYKETIKKKISAQGRHKKQSGGHGQFGDVWIEFEPTFGEPEFEFVDKVVGGAVPRNFIPAVEKGLRESIPKGVLAGYPMVNIRCTLYDGSSHPVDSSEMAFKVAASLAYKKGCSEANPVLLEPIGKAEVVVPDNYMGDVIGDLNKRRGRILGMNPSSEGQLVEAEVPMSEMVKYATDLRSMTHARGSFKLEFIRYEELPGNLAQKVIEKAKKETEE
ncbi:MAG: elongation factor G [Eubacteriales bacterium]